MSKSTVPVGLENDVDVVVANGLRSGRMLTMSFIVATLMYVAVGILIVPGREEATTVLPWQQVGMLLAAIVAAVIALLVLPALYSIERIVAKQDNVSVVEAVQNQVKGFAIGMAIIEVVALFGFIATFITANLQYVIIYSVYAVAMQLLLMVRRSQTLRDSRPTLQQLA